MIGYFVAKQNTSVCELAWDKSMPDALGILLGTISDHFGSQTIRFSCFLPEIVDHVSRNSLSPSLYEMRQERHYIQKHALYCGLFKLINNTSPALQTVTNTAELNTLFRNSNYVFWDFDHF